VYQQQMYTGNNDAKKSHGKHEAMPKSHIRMPQWSIQTELSILT